MRAWYRVFSRAAGASLALLLTACSLTTAQPPTPTVTPDAFHVQDTPLIVAWADGGDLFTWRSDMPTPRRIASGGVIWPFLSPDGAWVAYLRGPDGDPASLWLSDTPGTAERQLLAASELGERDEARRFSQIIWANGADTIYFNTLVGQHIDTRPADDLWRVEIHTGFHERLLPDGEGGTITISPDGSVLALASTGTYQGRPGAVAFYTPTTDARAVALEFPAVATGSEWRWHPDIRWRPDSSGVLTAIPPVDLVYGGAELTTALWWLPVGGQAVPTGQVEADFFGLPTFSAEGDWLAYIRRRETLDQAALALVIAHADGSEAVLYAEGAVGKLTPVEWLPAGNRFVFGQGVPGAWWIGQPGSPAARFPREDVPVSVIVWAGPSAYVFSVLSGEHFTLNAGALDNDSSPLLQIAVMSSHPLFDAVKNP